MRVGMGVAVRMGMRVIVVVGGGSIAECGGSREC